MDGAIVRKSLLAKASDWGLNLGISKSFNFNSKLYICIIMEIFYLPMLKLFETYLHWEEDQGIAVCTINFVNDIVKILSQSIKNLLSKLTFSQIFVRFVCYSCNNITTSLIQISRHLYFGFFTKTNHQMII